VQVTLHITRTAVRDVIKETNVADNLHVNHSK
jgi:hypothetical protein